MECLWINSRVEYCAPSLRCDAAPVQRGVWGGGTGWELSNDTTWRRHAIFSRQNKAITVWRSFQWWRIYKHRHWQLGEQRGRSRKPKMCVPAAMLFCFESWEYFSSSRLCLLQRVAESAASHFAGSELHHYDMYAAVSGAATKSIIPRWKSILITKRYADHLISAIVLSAGRERRKKRCHDLLQEY